MNRLGCLLVLTCALVATDAVADDTEPIAGRVAREVALLSSTRQATREKASRRLVALGRPALGPLRKHLAEAKVLDLKLRLKKIILTIRLTPPIPAAASTSGFRARVTQVYPWCDHMPVMGSGERRQYLILKLELRNLTTRPLAVDLVRCYFSFDARTPGAAVAGVTVRGKDGRGSGSTRVVLKPGELRTVEYRGDNLYPEGKHGQRLHVIFLLRSGTEDVLIRGSGEVLATS